VGRRAEDRESQKTCRLSRIVNNGKVAGSRYEDTEPLEVKESWVQALSLQKDSGLFLLEVSGFSVQVSVCLSFFPDT
jgi:hypothetical protein